MKSPEPRQVFRPGEVRAAGATCEEKTPDCCFLSLPSIQDAESSSSIHERHCLHCQRAQKELTDRISMHGVITCYYIRLHVLLEWLTGRGPGSATMASSRNSPGIPELLSSGD